MVFPSVPVYLDPPNWNQASQQPAIGGVGSGVDATHQLPVAVQPRPEGSMAAGTSTVKPGSMADRARLAKVPQPEASLNCPRCDSTNTKFCYFNNYSLSQPRHFCKTCRRYWTRGGSLRNVPVGGGCRRNKRSKGSGSSSSKSSSAASSSSSVASASGGAIPSNVPPHAPQMPFMASLHPVADYGAGASMGLSFGAVHPMDTVSFHAGGSSGAGLQEQWRLQQVQQFPFLAGHLEPPPPPVPSMGLFPFDGQGLQVDGGAGGFAGQVHGKTSASGFNTHLAMVKMEDDREGLNLPRHYLGITSNDQYWGGSGRGSGTGGGGDSGSGSGGGWVDLTGFNSIL